MVKFNLKKSYPHLVAILSFVVLSTVYFSPQLKGYIIKQHDIENFLGMSKEIVDYREKYDEDPLWTNSTFGGMPAYQISVQNTNIVNTLKNFILRVIPRPIGYMFFLMLGFYIMMLCFNASPWVALIGSIAFGLSSLNLLYLGNGHNAKVHAISFIPPIVGGIIMAYRKKLWLGAALASLFLCLHISANHLQMTYYLLFLIVAIVIFELYRHIKENALPKFIKASAILLVAGGLGILPTFSNILITKEYSEYTTRGESELTITGNNDVDDSKNKALDRDYIKQYSLSKGEVWSLVFPNVKGGRSGALGNNREVLKTVDPKYRETVSQQNAYWGEQYSSGGTFYFGASVFLLCILGLFFLKDKIKWAFLAAMVLAILLSWKYGTLVDFFIDNVPMFNQFRDTKMILILVQLSLPLLGVLFVQYLIKNEVDKKKLLYVIGGVSGLFLLFIIAPELWFSFLNRAETDAFNNQLSAYKNNVNYYNNILGVKEALIGARIEIFKKDGIRTLFFILATGAVVYLYALKKIKNNMFIVILIFIVLIDIWSVSKRYLNNDKHGSQYISWVDAYDYMHPFKPTTADLSILESELQDKPELNAKIEIEVSEMKNIEKLNRNDFQNEQMIKMFSELNLATDYRVVTLQNPFNTGRESYFHKSLGGYHGAKLRKYNEVVEYQISRELGVLQNYFSKLTQETFSGELPNLKIPVLNMLNTKYVIASPNNRAFLNPNIYGNAWFVKQINEVENADEEIMALSSLDKYTAIVQKKNMGNLFVEIQFDSSAVIHLEQYRPNHLIYKSKTSTDQIAVFSEIYYEKGWNAYIDGNPSDHTIANYLLRAMVIPAGEHTIEFKFEPETYYKGQKLSMVGSGLIVLFVLLCIYMTFKENQKDSSSEEA